MKRVCVFCGSSAGYREDLIEAARELGKALVRGRHDLVYGGAHVGLMGTVADTVLEQGGRVTGVIPRSMREREIAHTGLTELRVVETMHERKALMADLSDGFIALPGAYGTLDELFEILTWGQLGIHAKPVGVLNVDGFFDLLFAFLDRTVEAGLLKQANRELFVAAGAPGELLERMAAHRPVAAAKWIGREAR
ncbi:MAG: TIGR00730 family Rossman fold protein [Bryobacterales bacterium]|nr:TIGR00730 family Rossman fold protein [Bryobacterales bacterium]